MKKLFITAALIVTAIIGMSMSAHSQIYVPPGTTIKCLLRCHGLIFIRLSNGTFIILPEETNGQSTFQSLGSNHRGGGDFDDPTSCSFTPISMTLTGNDPTYGDYSFSFDDSRTPSNTVITANQVGSDFPATGDVYANVTGTIAGLPGTFTNVNECHMRSTDLQSFNPHVNETYEFVEDVLFTSDDPADGTTFTIPAGSTVVLN